MITKINNTLSYLDSIRNKFYYDKIYLFKSIEENEYEIISKIFAEMYYLCRELIFEWDNRKFDFKKDTHKKSLKEKAKNIQIRIFEFSLFLKSIYVDKTDTLKRILENLKMLANINREINDKYNYSKENENDLENRIKEIENKREQEKAQTQELVETQEQALAQAYEDAKVKAQALTQASEEIKVQAQALNNALAQFQNQELLCFRAKLDLRKFKIINETDYEDISNILHFQFKNYIRDFENTEKAKINSIHKFSNNNTEQIDEIRIVINVVENNENSFCKYIMDLITEETITSYGLEEPFHNIEDKFYDFHIEVLSRV